MSMAAADSFRQFRVPQASGNAIVVPPITQIESELRSFVAEQALRGLEFCGLPLANVRCEARREVMQLALGYTSAYRNVPSGLLKRCDTSPIILSGHQPELYHPGVWFKNFLLSRLAQESSAVAINFLVDNDLCRSTAIRVPSRTVDGRVSAISVEYDRSSDSVPWELRRAVDRDCWKTFADRVGRTLVREVREPLVTDLWRYADEALQRSGRIGWALAEARHQLEGEIGLQTLEVPLSQLASTRAFARFSIQLLTELPRLQSVYNAQRDIYRAAHRIRSSAHPVPALEQQNGWLEAPWWIYRSDAPKRQRLWVKMVDNQLQLSDGGSWQASIDGRLESDEAAEQWMQLASQGVCLRPRALLTTMFLRLIVGDAFIHGIGGGKYDQLTDAIIQEFFGVTPPTVIVASATMRLPQFDEAQVIENIGTQNHGSENELTQSALVSTRDQKAKIRDLQQHPEVFAGAVAKQQPDHSQEIEDLLKQKQQLLANIPPRGQKWEWNHQISSVNRRLAELNQQQAEVLESQLAEVAELERQQRVLASRELSFCLFERDFLVAQLQRLARS